MKKSRFTETQIVSILKQTDAGVPVKDIVFRPVTGTATGHSRSARWQVSLRWLRFRCLGIRRGFHA